MCARRRAACAARAPTGRPSCATRAATAAATSAPPLGASAARAPTGPASRAARTRSAAATPARRRAVRAVRGLMDRSSTAPRARAAAATRARLRTRWAAGAAPAGRATSSPAAIGTHAAATPASGRAPSAMRDHPIASVTAQWSSSGRTGRATSQGSTTQASARPPVPLPSPNSKSTLHSSQRLHRHDSSTGSRSPEIQLLGRSSRALRG